MKGTVVWFDNGKGFGFIQNADGGDDVFVHFSQIQQEGYKKLDQGDLVEFEVGVGGPKNREQAENVRVLQRARA